MQAESIESTSYRDLNHEVVRIAHFIPTLNVGGAERALVRHVQQLSREKGYEHLIITAKGSDSWLSRELDELVHADVGVQRCSLSERGLRLGGIVRAYRLLKRYQPSLYHGWSYHGNVMASFFRFLLPGKAPLVWGIRHSLRKLSDESRNTRISLFLGRLFCKLRFRSGFTPSALVYNSSASREQHERYGLPDIRSQTISNGIPTPPDRSSLRAKLRERYQISNECFVVFHAARFHKMKGHQYLIEAFARLKEKIEREELPFGAKLVLVGRGVTSENAELAHFVEQSGVSDSVLLLGEASDLFSLFPVADCFVLSSIFGEGFPNVVAEAMISGLPTVATDVGDTRRVLGKAGILIQPSSVDSLTGSLTSSLSAALFQVAQMSPQERVRMGQECKRHITERFSEKACAESYEKVYKELLAL